MINPPTATDISILTAAIKLLETVKSDLAGAFTLEHLNAAEPWPDRFECLKWAVENRATVAEMKAWHRAQNHMDLFKDDGVN